MPFKDEATVPGVPNYTPAQMRRWALVVSSMMTFLAVSSIFVRLISRRIRQQKLWLDDYMIMFSMVRSCIHHLSRFSSLDLSSAFPALPSPKADL